MTKNRYTGIKIKVDESDSDNECTKNELDV